MLGSKNGTQLFPEAHEKNSVSFCRRTAGSCYGISRFTQQEVVSLLDQPLMSIGMPSSIQPVVW